MKFSRILNSPLGDLQLIATSEALTGINWPNSHEALAMSDSGHNSILDLASSELRQYFQGDLTAFSIPLTPNGTPFQKRVWSALIGIDWGTTCSYKQIACAVDKPTASRAVGTAIGKNPLPIVIPCHRVLGSNGSLTGFSGGLITKKTLLRLEMDQSDFVLV